MPQQPSSPRQQHYFDLGVADRRAGRPQEFPSNEPGARLPVNDKRLDLPGQPLQVGAAGYWYDLGYEAGAAAPPPGTPPTGGPLPPGRRRTDAQLQAAQYPPAVARDASGQVLNQADIDRWHELHPQGAPPNVDHGQGQQAPPPPGPPVPGTPPAGLSQEEARALYEAGYADGASGRAPRTDFDPERAGHYNLGYRAGLDSRPPAGPPPPLRFPWDPTVSYEVVAYFQVDIAGTMIRRAVPYDLAVIGGLVVPSFGFTLLGNEPADWGPKPRGRGFGLSGPRGAAVQLAAQQLPGQVPAQHGLPAWICTMTRSGPRLLSRAAMHKIFSLPL